MKDLSTYALCYAAVLIAAIAAVGLIASTADPGQAAQPQAVAVHAAAPQAGATMNIPF